MNIVFYLLYFFLNVYMDLFPFLTNCNLQNILILTLNYISYLKSEICSADSAIIYYKFITVKYIQYYTVK